MFHYIHTLIMFKHVNFGKHLNTCVKNEKKNILILKFHPGMKCLHVFFSFFHPGMKSHPCLSSRDEISSRQKRVNSKRHFTIDRDDFIPRQVSSRDEISRVNTLIFIKYLWNIWSCYLKFWFNRSLNHCIRFLHNYFDNLLKFSIIFCTSTEVT